MHSRRNSWLDSIVVSYFLGIFGAAVGGELTDDSSKAGETKKRVAMRVAKMVDDLANRNAQPEIVIRCDGRPTCLPLFPKDYDWKEEERVRESVSKVYKDSTIELWEELVTRANDSRYCVVTWDSGENAKIYSVGDACKNLAYARLSGRFENHLPSLSPKGCPIRLESLIKDLPRWRKERADKPLYQLQIEVCELVIQEIPIIDGGTLSDKDKAIARSAIENEIKTLKNSKAPIFKEYGGNIAPYSREMAKEIRKVIKSGSSEDILFEK